jgi:citrate lyase subunit beta / citryl-CoA lyase
VSAPPLTWLYVPADRPDRVEKALASAAHAVIVDLEDAVAPDAKREARAALPALLAGTLPKPVHVRVNSLASPWGRDDVAALAGLDGVTGLTLPKVERPEEAHEVVALSAGLRVHCLIETALGVELAFAIASEPGVTGISLGEADLSAQTGARGEGLDWARARIVNAAAAAGIDRPQQSVYPHVRDAEGLARTCEHGRELGFLGRGAIHPAQLPVIERAYLPSAEELERARGLVDAFAAQPAGALQLADGRFVDVALLRAAEQTVALAAAHGTR